ncbi:Sister chromatid cohesion protein 2 [Cladophialophora chaetospira]|uniref:Sister chromatid cohesion protein n=1 Tax=Cladophialophora chaetospira TaxID=386627 RepID=A0AA39CM87_9EURO|nr:Sister chromatid cohesion protein 2 [Cladophialophora chaetospira]
MATGGIIEVVVPRRPQNGAHSRQLSVDQALQYTPMTTSVLPAHDRIPLPQLGRSLDPRLTSPNERHAVYRSELFTTRVKERLAVLLDPSRLAEIKFRRPPVQHASKTQSELHDVPKMILKMSKMDYTYPASSTVSRSVAKKPTLQMPVIKPGVAKVVVEVPKPPASFNRGDYAAIPDSPKRRKLAASTSKRQKDDQLLVTLENQLLEIFEAQDRFAPDTSGTVKSNSAIFDQSEDEDDSEDLRLAVRTHKDLQDTLSQLVSSGRLTDASTEYLKRLQLLCEPAIEAAQTLNLRAPSDPSNEDISTWLSKLRKGRSGAASACTLIYTVLGAPHNQELVNLEALQWLPNLLVNLFENCLIPVVEARPDGQQSQLFELASSYSETLRHLLDDSRKLLDLVARVCVEIKGASPIVNSTEFLASKLIFVQNAHTDKASAIGSQTYERLRKQAMAAVARFYAAFPAERSAILDEVLSSLDKLPSNSRSARQYKLGGNKNIQLVSALFMQLVQTSAMQSGKKEKGRARHLLRQTSLDPGDSNSEGDAGSDMEVDSMSSEKDPHARLTQTAKTLFNDAFQSAQHIVMWMVDKASKVTKTGDSPYRNILDLFVEDLTLVFSSTDWPASELLLTVLAYRMVLLVQNGKSASTKNMALESLGVMGSAISVTRASARNLLSSILREGESSSSTVAQALSDLVREQVHFFLQDHDLVSPNGPFPIVHSYLAQKGGEGLRTKSAKAYFLVQYSILVSRVTKEQRNGEQNSQPNTNFEPTIEALLLQLCEADQFDESADDYSEIKGSEAQLAYLLSILNGQFCRRFPEIAKTLASSLHSDQAQVRSRSLKSVAAMLETDSSLLELELTLVDAVFKCASDDSSLVRDSALSLIARFIMPRPAFEEKAFKRLLKCAADSNIGVQKRAIGHLKDVYLRETRSNMKATIAIEFLRRAADQETSVAELAKKTLTEIWIEPRLAGLASAGDTAQVDVAIEDLKTHIVTCIGSDTASLSSLLKTFLTWKLKDTKSASQVRELCARIVKKLLDTANGSDAAAADLTTLVAFAEARPETVVPADLASLKSYLKDLSKHDNILKFKSVVAIFRSVLPHLSGTQAPLLEDVQLDLLKAAQKLVPRQELEEVMSCLRSIDGVLQNNSKTAAFAISLLKNVLQPNIPPQVRDELKRQNKFEELKVRENRMREQSLRLVGVVGKHIDLERFRAKFQDIFSSFEPPYKGGSVAGYIADCIGKFTLRKSPVEVRLKALEGLGLVCQAWPGQFNKTFVRETFFEVLKGGTFGGVDDKDVLKMQVRVLEVFEELYRKRASMIEEAKKAEDGAEVQALKNIGGDSKTREDDSAIATITNDLVDHLLRIIKAETGEKALLAAQTLASIDHQGMTHPKQSTSAFVALETSQDAQVANIAKVAHEHLHQQHESVCEREYINAIQAAFRYQNEVFNDPRGGVVPGFTAKLAPAFTIIGTSGSKYVKKFLSNLISKINTEYLKLVVMEQGISEHLLFVLFVTQNLAFFDYKKMDELLHTVLQLELAFGKNGAETAQAIETHIPPPPVVLTEDNEAAEPVKLEAATEEAPIDPILLKRLATAASAITLISEARNFLKRQYAISRDVKMAIQQTKQTKDAGKEPVKVHGITGDRFWENTNAVLQSLTSNEAMIARCREFVTLVAVDDEVKIAEEEAELNGLTAAGPELGMSAPRGKKRKSGSGSIGGTPKRPRGRPPKNGYARRSTSVSSLEEDPDGDFNG